MDNQEKKKIPGWAVGLLIIFYPIGILYLICKLLRKNREDLKKTANILRWIAGFLIFSGVVYSLEAATGGLEAESKESVIYGVVIMLLMAVGGVALLSYANKLSQRAKLVDKYTPAIFQQGLEDLEQIAAVSGVGYDQALRDLQLLHSKGLLQDRYLDHQAGKLVWPGKPIVQETVDAVVCPHCGATNRIPTGGRQICEYCDSEI